MKIRPFEITLLAIFGILTIVSLFLLRSIKSEPKEGVVDFGGPVNIWGTLPEEGFYQLLQDLAKVNDNYFSVKYLYVPEDDFDQTFVNALADGKGPDLLFLNQESLVQHRSRLEPTPYTIFPLIDLKSSYIDGAQIFALQDGIYGYPVAVDPLMLYWNRDLFSGVNLIAAPATWEEIVAEVVPSLTIRDFNLNISQSAIALGEYDNIRNALPIISMLLMQGGSSLVTENGNSYKVALDNSLATTKSTPFSEAVSFYVNFNNVSNTLYSWNKARAVDRELFLSEKLAMYFGFGSEAKLLESRNPNLNFDIAPVPQGATVTASAKRTYGLFYGFMIPKSAPNKFGANSVRLELTSQSNAKTIADAYNLAPVRRSTLAAGSNDIYGRQIYSSIPLARGWLNPNMNKTNEVFIKLLSDISANRSDVYTATSDAIMRLQQAY